VTVYHNMSSDVILANHFIRTSKELDLVSAGAVISACIYAEMGEGHASHLERKPSQKGTQSSTNPARLKVVRAALLKYSSSCNVTPCGHVNHYAT
jgi:hypothetical protein